MTGSLRFRIIVVVVAAVVALAAALPSLPGVRQSALGQYLPGNPINLGLDLKGGIHLTLGVDLDKAVENSLAQMGQEIKTLAKDEGLPLVRVQTLPGERLEFVLAKADKAEDLEKLLKTHFARRLVVQNTQRQEGDKILYAVGLVPEYKTNLAQLTLDQAVKTIRNRIDQFGVAEPDIRAQRQDGRIQIQLPGLQDPERAIQIIGKTAHLEFKLVDDEADPAKTAKGVLAPGSELGQLRHRNPDGSYVEQPIALKKDAILTGESVADAAVSYDQYNKPYVTMNFNPAGARAFERITAENVKKRLAIILDGKVYSAPVIQEKIGGGRASITGQFSTEEARDLAVVLRAGALPAPVNVLEQRTVGPSLGQESIDKGVMSALIGTGVILVFMVVYYGAAGLVANMALLLNVVMLMAGLALFGATLTLPGIAGVILTVGIAVDASVLIYERIREELAKGMTPRTAVDHGFSRATLTILDANVTTLITAAILYEFGTGPVRGFAITLILGILASMFTAIFAARVVFDLWLGRLKPGASLSI